MMPHLRMVAANGLDFAILEEGSGPLVLLLHGFPDTAHTWSHTLPVLAKAGYRAVAPFTRGYAPTSIPTTEDYGADTLGRDALALIEALGEKSAILIGHDWGASAAYSAAGLGPERIRFLITVAIPHPAAIIPTPMMMWRARHFWMLSRQGAAAQIRAHGLRELEELYRRWSPGWEVPASETDSVRASLGHPGSLEAALGYYRALSPLLPASQRRKLTVPAAVFAGTDDNLISVPAYRRARSRYLSSYEVIPMPGSHFMHRQYPEQFNRELLRVLSAFESKK
jgi:pimeloyl-ACP methyl ester carboxylesterase